MSNAPSVWYIAPETPHCYPDGPEKGNYPMPPEGTPTAPSREEAIAKAAEIYAADAEMGLLYIFKMRQDECEEVVAEDDDNKTEEPKKQGWLSKLKKKLKKQVKASKKTVKRKRTLVHLVTSVPREPTGHI